MNKIALFSFYDPEGIVDDYVIYFLNEIQKYYSEIHCMANGFLKDNSKEKLNSVCKTVSTRENKGFDAWGYKTLIEQLGYDKLKNFDEVLCFNHTCFGPIFSLDNMFSKMDNTNCDMWGLYFTKAPKGEKYIQGEHIPSYFVAYKKSLVEKPEFKEFWDTMSEINNYDDAVKLYEQRQTPFFKTKGFKIETAFDFSAYQKMSDWWFLEFQDKMLIQGKLPFLKRRPFFKEKNRIQGMFYRKVIAYIKRKTNYDINLIKQNLDRTQNISTVKEPSVLNVLWWKFMAKFSKKKQKYIDRLKNVISQKELQELFLKEDVHE